MKRGEEEHTRAEMEDVHLYLITCLMCINPPLHVKSCSGGHACNTSPEI